MQDFADPESVLDALDDALHKQYEITNDNIRAGDNPHVQFKKNGLFSITTPKQEETDAEPLQGFFPDRQYVPLSEVLATVNRYAGFLDEFQHWQQRYNRRQPPPKTFYAGVIGLGCGIGTRKIAQISRQIEESELEHTVKLVLLTGECGCGERQSGPSHGPLGLAERLPPHTG